MSFATINHILAGIDELEGRHCDSETPAFSTEHGFDHGMVFIPIRCLSRVWGENETASEALSRCQTKLLGGLKDALAAWSYMVVGNPDRLSVYLGLPGGHAAFAVWSRVLCGVFPGCCLGEASSAAQILAEIGAPSHVAAFTGNPSIPPSGRATASNSTSSPGCLDSLFRAMLGAHWAYMVFGQPVPEPLIASEVSLIEREEREVTSAYLRRGSAEENNNPIARHYVELLRAAHASHLEGKRSGLWDVQVYLLSRARADLLTGMQVLAGEFSGPESKPQPVRVRMCLPNARTGKCPPPLTRLTSREVSALASLPTAEFPGLQIRERVEFASSGSESNGFHPVAIGCVLHDGRRSQNWFDIDRDDLSKHALVTGVTGSGKTVSCQYILRQLWEEHGVPWLVLEPSLKAEYRQLLGSPLGSDLRIFTLGDETAVPFRFNPLEVQPGVHVQTHIDSLLSLFNAAFAWVTPMPIVLSLAVHRIYEEFGWDLSAGTNPRGFVAETQPALSDLIAKIPSVVNDLGYDGEVCGNLRAGLLTRLSNLTLGAKGLMLNSGVSIPMDYLLSKPAILEFSIIGNDEEKAFLLGALLIRLAQYRRNQGFSSALRHLVLVEEAHRLLSATPAAVGLEQANPRAKAVEEFCNLLAETRAYGQGLIVADQIPAKLAPDIIKNANLKICHRLVAADDRKQVGDCMNLSEPQQRFLATLAPGQAVAFREGREQAFFINVPNHIRHGSFEGPVPTKAAIVAHMKTRLPDLPKARVRVAPCKLLPCAGCLGGRCTLRDAVVRELLSRDHREAYSEALEGGFQGLWTFGTSVAKSALDMNPLPPDAPYCVAMNLCAIAGYSSDVTERVQRNMEILRDHAKRECGKS